MKKGDKVKVPLADNKYAEAVVKEVEHCKGAFGSYPYAKVTVIMPDKSLKTFRDFDIIFVPEETKKVDKKK